MADSIWRCRLTSMIPIVEIIRLYGRLISTMWIPILVRHLDIESRLTRFDCRKYRYRMSVLCGCTLFRKYTNANIQHLPDILRTIYWGDTQVLLKAEKCVEITVYWEIREVLKVEGCILCTSGLFLNTLLEYFYCVGNLLPAVLNCQKVCLVIKVSSLNITCHYMGLRRGPIVGVK